MNNKELSLNQNIDACRVAQNRTRVTMAVTVSASVLVFAAFWNSWQGSWINKRLHRTNDALELKIWNVHLRDSLKTDELRNRFDKARSFALIRDIADSSHLAEVNRGLQKILTDEVNNIRVPFFGIIFDVNDLGIASGLAFIALLSWLRFCLLREQENLKFTIDEADSQNKLSYCYHVLSMHQLFTLPEIDKQVAAFWRRTPIFLMWLPMLVHTIVFGHDLYSYKYGLTISILNTVIVYVISLISLSVIISLTISCSKLLNAIDKVWVEQIIPTKL